MESFKASKPTLLQVFQLTSCANNGVDGDDDSDDVVDDDADDVDDDDYDDDSDDGDIHPRNTEMNRRPSLSGPVSRKLKKKDKNSRESAR